jgi:hypothetical protein
LIKKIENFAKNKSFTNIKNEKIIYVNVVVILLNIDFNKLLDMMSKAPETGISKHYGFVS